MLALPKILLPVDFSERSPGAARYAKALACHFHSDLTLIHVMDVPAYAMGGLEFGGAILAQEPAARQRSLELLERFREQYFDSAARCIVMSGDPAQEIVKLAHEQNISLIVLPTHGYGPFRRFILGSVTTKILHDADCPVWTGIHLAEAPDVESMSFANILCAVDLESEPERGLPFAASLAESFGGRLTIIHATPSLEGRTGEYFDPDWRSYLAQQAREEIGKLQERLSVKADVVINDGDVAKVVCSTAEQLHADVLVIGRGASSGILGRLRTHAYAIIRQSPCPVVSV